MHGSFASVLLCFHVRLCGDLRWVVRCKPNPPSWKKMFIFAWENAMFYINIKQLKCSFKQCRGLSFRSPCCGAGFFFSTLILLKKQKEAVTDANMCSCHVKRCGELCGSHTEWCLTLTAWRTDRDPHPQRGPSVSRQQNGEGRWPSRPSDESSPPFVHFFCAAEQTRAR